VNRANAFKNQLVNAGALINVNDIPDACKQLASTLGQVDGKPNPADSFTGSAVPVLAQEITMLRTTLGCP
jgi:hypothetical protein